MNVVQEAVKKTRQYMVKFHKSIALSLMATVLVFAFITTIIIQAATTPSLGMAASYGVLASTYTNTTPTTINGDVGFTTGPAVAPSGTHDNYGSGAPYAAAGTDQGAALSALNAEACTFTWNAAVDLSTDATHGTVGTYSPGVYCSIGAMSVTGPLTLNGSGTYIFRAVGALNTAASATVTLTGGASACDVFWTPSGATTLGANTTFMGTAISDAGITVGANTTWTGRALAFGGTVTTDTTTLTVPTCTPPPVTLHVVKEVVNDDGGSAVASDFSIHVKNADIDVAGSPAAGVVAPGTLYTLPSGTYTVSEDINNGYDATFSGDCNSGGEITLAPGEDKTCTITNNDRTASINVVKAIINDSGRTKTVADFPLFVSGTPVASGDTTIFAPGTHVISETTSIDYVQSFSGDCNAAGSLGLAPGDNKFCIVTNDDIAEPVVVPPIPPLIEIIKVPSPFSLPAGPGLVTYTFTLRNIGTVTATNITVDDDSCSPLSVASGDSNSNGQLEVSETWVYTCAKTLSQTHTNNVVATAMANGLSAVDIASATVAVGSLAVPPLIHVTKVPSPVTLSVGGGMVTYTEKITNPGTVPLSNVTLNDDKCSPVKYINGDTNNNSMLDTNETWIYTCSTNLTKTTTNTAIASGEANGFTARDIAVATVTVAGSVPGLPNTGDSIKR